jgi:hypothetical protein
VSGRVRLDCPLCRAVISDGDPPRPGRCPSCGARYLGDGESASAAVAAALAELGLDDLPADRVATGLFVAAPGLLDELALAVTSDARDGFYRWWLFAGEGAGALRERLERLLAEAAAAP